MGASILQLNTARADKVRSRWEVVTPELATKWLEGNTHNRSVRDSVVARYAADMKAGRWKQTHQGIAFDEDNTLIDGQHRLYAVLEAKTPVIMLVTTGLLLDSQAVVDDGIKRSVVDILKVSDEAMSGMSNLHAAVAERMFKGLSATAHSARTRQEQSLFLRRHWEAVNFAVSMFPLNKRVRGVTNAQVLAVMARAFYHEDRAVLTRFGRIMWDGQSEDARDFTAIKLRNWLLVRKKGLGGGTSALEVYAKSERALHAFAHNESVGRNLIPVTEELYPLPKGGK